MSARPPEPQNARHVPLIGGIKNLDRVLKVFPEPLPLHATFRSGFAADRNEMHDVAFNAVFREQNIVDENRPIPSHIDPLPEAISNWKRRLVNTFTAADGTNGSAHEVEAAFTRLARVLPANRRSPRPSLWRRLFA